MQIQLKQKEIEAALRLYIAQQGINLIGKSVSVIFTSGRKDNGLTAELSIEDSSSASDLPTTEAAKVTEVTEDPAEKPSLFT